LEEKASKHEGGQIAACKVKRILENVPWEVFQVKI
jgi:hypothetical protein